MGKMRRPGLTLLTVAALAAGAVLFSGGHASMADPNETGPDGFPIIFWTVASDDQRAVKKLLDAGANINDRGFAEQTPVLKAAMSNSWAMVDFLISQGADVRMIDARGFNLPWLAQDSSLSAGSENGAALYQKVIPRLKSMGLMDKLYHPREAAALVAGGGWPPPEWR